MKRNNTGSSDEIDNSMLPNRQSRNKQDRRYWCLPQQNNNELKCVMALHLWDFVKVGSQQFGLQTENIIHDVKGNVIYYKSKSHYLWQCTYFQTESMYVRAYISLSPKTISSTKPNESQSGQILRDCRLFQVSTTKFLCQATDSSYDARSSEIEPGTMNVRLSGVG